MNFEFDDNVPIYIQLVEQLKTYIISGQVKCGERLPSVRDLANQIKVNPNTVQKAMIELEDLGLVYTEKTNGKYVTTNEKLIERLKCAYADELSNKYFIGMKNIGFTKTDALKFLRKLGTIR